LFHCALQTHSSTDLVTAALKQGREKCFHRALLDTNFYFVEHYCVSLTK